MSLLLFGITIDDLTKFLSDGILVLFAQDSLIALASDGAEDVIAI